MKRVLLRILRADALCPKCRWATVRPSRKRTVLDLLLRPAFLVPFRCLSCRRRFYRFQVPAACPLLPPHRFFRSPLGLLSQVFSALGLFSRLLLRSVLTLVGRTARMFVSLLERSAFSLLGLLRQVFSALSLFSRLLLRSVLTLVGRTARMFVSL